MPNTRWSGRAGSAMPYFQSASDRYVSKAELGEVQLSGSENFSCRYLQPYTASLNIS
jgi:hypothetical protein